MTKSLQHQWTFFQRVIPDIAHLFSPVESAIAEHFVPAIYSEKVSASVRTLSSLPVRCAGIAITNPVTTSQSNYVASTIVCSHLIQAIQGKSEFCEMSHNGCLLSRFKSAEMRVDAADEAHRILLETLPLPRDRRAIERGCKTGSFLSAVPSTINGSTLGEIEFQDSIRLRAALPLLNLPSHCDGCGENFTIAHAHSCKNGGNIIARHDEIVAELVSLSTMAFKPNAVRAEPQIHTGSSTAKSDSDSTVETSDRGDVLVRGLWSTGQDAILDIRVTDTDQASYVTRDPERVLQSHEKEKKRKYLRPCQQQRRAFTPFVVSVDGLIGIEAKNVMKALSRRLALKWQKPYSLVMNIVKTRISIACVRASHRCTRGSRVPVRKMSRQIQWDDGAGLGLYRIDTD